MSIAPEPGATFTYTYTYDFGDDWTHTVTLDEVRPEGPLSDCGSADGI